MLFRREILQKIRTGEITAAFRKWKRPTVKTGGTLITPIGQLRIKSVEKVELEKITLRDVVAAGFSDHNELQNILAKKEEGQIYCVHFAVLGEDPRIVLRNSTQLTEDDLSAISGQLEKYDRNSRHGPWTMQLLQQIKHKPGVVSTQLASDLGFDRQWMKTQVRKLKAMGLTISLEVGYQLSPRGKAYLDRLH